MVALNPEFSDEELRYVETLIAAGEEAARKAGPGLRLHSLGPDLQAGRMVFSFRDPDSESWNDPPPPAGLTLDELRRRYGLGKA